jgi:uncharacterized protein
MIGPHNFVVIRSKPGGVVIDVHVITRAGKSGLAGTRGGSLLVRLQAAPVEGAANAELVALLSAALHVPRRAISIVTGARSRQKRVQVEGVDVATASSRLLRPQTIA